MEDHPSKPHLSVIAAYNGSWVLSYFLKSLEAQTLEGDEFELVLGCEAGSEPIGVDLTKFRFRVKSVACEIPRHFFRHTAARLRNAAIGASEGERLVFVDSDCVLEPNCLNLHKAACKETALCGAKREALVTAERLEQTLTDYRATQAVSPPDYRTRGASGTAKRRAYPWEDFCTSNASAPRHRVVEAGLFDESGFRCHDVDLGYRLSRCNVRFLFDPACEVVHIEHPRSLWFRRSQAAGSWWMAKKHPELTTFAEDLVAVYHKAFSQTLLECEIAFRKICRTLPGIRAGLAWVTPPGIEVPRIHAAIGATPFVRQDKNHCTQLYLRFHEKCWDYSIIIPDADVSRAPCFSIIIRAHKAGPKLKRTLDSVFCQSYQSFEVIVAADGASDGCLRTAIAYGPSNRLRLLTLPRGAGPAVLMNRALATSRAPYFVPIDAGQELEEVELERLERAFSLKPDVGAACEARSAVPADSALDGRMCVADIATYCLKSDRPPMVAVYRVPPLLAVAELGLRLEHNRGTTQWPLDTEPCHESPPSSPQPGMYSLTFDAGPHPVFTSQILDALGEAGCRATFFVLGGRVAKSPEVCRRMLREGHELGLQGLWYEDLSRCSFKELSRMLRRSLQLAETLVGTRPRWFRPPYGRCPTLVHEVCESERLELVTWDVSSRDWTGHRFCDSLARVAAAGMGNQVLQFHDGCGDPQETARAIAVLGRVGRDLGLRSATVSELAQCTRVPSKSRCCRNNAWVER
jgi:peptidoglycan/xylan/chitin deacetylase (PgdA/CDA1 family)